jgi:hypothetical protein
LSSGKFYTRQRVEIADVSSGEFGAVGEEDVFHSIVVAEVGVGAASAVELLRY